MLFNDPVDHGFPGGSAVENLHMMQEPQEMQVQSLDLPNPGIKPRPLALQAESLPAEPQGEAKKTGVGSLSLLQQILPTKESNWDLLHCRRILYQLSYEGSPQVRVAIVKKCINKKLWRGYREKQCFYIVGGM